ncbi:MAG: hypothetical protein AAF497_13175 [Planctomycetota bacterium]
MTDTKDALDSLPPVRPVYNLFDAWLLYWLVVWFGTTVTGAVVGLSVGVCVTFYDGNPMSAIFATFLGLMVAGTVGVLVILLFAMVCWMLWLPRNPIVMAIAAGAIIGSVSGLVMFFVTGPIGGVGAWVAAQWYLSTPLGKKILNDEQQKRIARKSGEARFHFSLADLMWRMTALAIVLTLVGLAVRNM